MDNFLYSFNKFNQEQIRNVNRFIAPSKSEATIKSLPRKNERKKDGQEELMPILFKLFHKTETERTLPNSVYEDTVILIPKT